MRKQRNIADYSGDIIPESAAATCIAQAEALLEAFKAWLIRIESSCDGNQ